MHEVRANTMSTEHIFGELKAGRAFEQELVLSPETLAGLERAQRRLRAFGAAVRVLQPLQDAKREIIRAAGVTMSQIVQVQNQAMRSFHESLGERLAALARMEEADRASILESLHRDMKAYQDDLDSQWRAATGSEPPRTIEEIKEAVAKADMWRERFETDQGDSELQYFFLKQYDAVRGALDRLNTLAQSAVVQRDRSAIDNRTITVTEGASVLCEYVGNMRLGAAKTKITRAVNDNKIVNNGKHRLQRRLDLESFEIYLSAEVEKHCAKECNQNLKSRGVNRAVPRKRHN